MSAELLGDDFRLYHDGNNTYNAPSWSQIYSAGDVGLAFNNEQVNIPKRISYKVYKKGRADWELSFKCNYDATNSFHTAVRSAIENGTKIHLALADGAINTNNTHYWHAWWLLDGPLSGNLDEAGGFDVKGKLHHDTGTAEAEPPAAATV